MVQQHLCWPCSADNGSPAALVHLHTASFGRFLVLKLWLYLQLCLCCQTIVKHAHLCSLPSITILYTSTSSHHHYLNTSWPSLYSLHVSHHSQSVCACSTLIPTIMSIYNISTFPQHRTSTTTAILCTSPATHQHTPPLNGPTHPATTTRPCPRHPQDTTQPLTTKHTATPSIKHPFSIMPLPQVLATLHTDRLPQEPHYAQDHAGQAQPQTNTAPHNP